MAVGKQRPCTYAEELLENLLSGGAPITVVATPAAPLHVQALQQVVLDEVETVDVKPTPPGVLTGDPLSILDKDLGTGINYTVGGVVTVTYKMGILIARVSISGDTGTVTSVIVTDTEGVAHELVDVAKLMVNGWDSKNFDPIMAAKIQITTTGETNIYEVNILKAIEVKAAANRNLVPIETFDIGVGSGLSIGMNGLAVPPLAALAGAGVLIEKEKQNAVVLDLLITAAVGIGVLNVDVHWYYSEDNVMFYYMATTSIVKAIAANEPSGFIAAGGTAQQAIAQPVGAFNKYIAVAVQNKDVNAVLVAGRFIRQR